MIDTEWNEWNASVKWTSAKESESDGNGPSRWARADDLILRTRITAVSDKEPSSHPRALATRSIATHASIKMSGTGKDRLPTTQPGHHTNPPVPSKGIQRTYLPQAHLTRAILPHLTRSRPPTDTRPILKGTIQARCRRAPVARHPASDTIPPRSSSDMASIRTNKDLNPNPSLTLTCNSSSSSYHHIALGHTRKNTRALPMGPRTTKYLSSPREAGLTRNPRRITRRIVVIWPSRRSIAPRVVLALYRKPYKERSHSFQARPESLESSRSLVAYSRVSAAGLAAWVYPALSRQVHRHLPSPSPAPMPGARTPILERTTQARTALARVATGADEGS
ncbi:uncharacterized protein DNG_08293 [Cephalotrichum gorgonifer]|uniref:Uncharacterized protein n=1 Tax=Cephalotrichum gorgonifer TaxID=2041049 RepID=A0AAE8N381_9PEZI|nr:uncharacterized protein DNG_08293 [Cephalotrichum gorgonifer]